MATNTYDANKVVLTFASVDLSSLGGFGDADFITVEWAADDIESKVGADGEVTFYRMNDERATVTFTVMEQSQVHQTLVALRAANRLSNGVSVGPLSLRDNVSGETFSGADAVIKSRPGPTKGRETSTREWVFEVANGKLTIT